VRKATRIAVGVGLTAVVFALLIGFIGVDRFVSTVTSVDPRYVAVIVGAILLRRVCQGTILYVAFNRFDVGIGFVQAVFLSAGSSFAKNVTPFAQFGGGPAAAAVATDALGARYERCLAALSTVETIRFLPSTTVFLFGSLYFLLFPTPVPSVVKPLFGLFGLFLLAVCLLAVVVWRYQRRAEGVLTGALTRVLGVASVLPVVSAPDEEDVRDRVTSFSSLFVDLTTDPGLVARVAVLAAANVLITVFELWLALRAVGVEVSFAIVLFAVPFSQLASILPSPGGVGGIEGVLVVFVTAITGDPARGVATGVVLSSGLGYWLTMSMGGLAVSVVLPVLGEE